MDATLEAEEPIPVAWRGRRNALLVTLWSLFRADDFLVAVGRGIWNSLVVHPERSAAQAVRAAFDGSGGAHVIAPGTRCVVLSDHHLLYQGVPHDYVSGFGRERFQNEAMLVQVLEHYAGEHYTLIENGDVEDLLVTEPSWWGVMFDSHGGSIGGFVSRKHQRLGRLRQLYGILVSYRAYHALLAKLFPEGRLIKLVGNHDVELLDPEFAAVLEAERPGTTLCEYAVVKAEGGSPGVVICHGHQFDPWTCSRTAAQVGESITESFAWWGAGADRIWLEEDWFADLVEQRSLDNRMAALSVRFSGRDRAPKIRHMPERPIPAAMNQAFHGVARPWLVLGHTHEPRFREADQYVNSASAGRYQNLIWAVELVDARPTLVSWRLAGGKLHRVVFEDRGDRLVPAAHVDVHTPHHMVLADLPLRRRRSTGEVAADVDRRFPPGRVAWGRLAVRLVEAIVGIGAGVGALWAWLG